jgi:predicted transcriptional regulator
LTILLVLSTLRYLEIEMTPEQEAQLADDHFSAGVRKGIEEADRGELIEETDMDARVERMLQG